MKEKHAVRMGDMRTTYKILMEKLQGKRPLRRHRRRCKDNMKIGFKETVWNRFAFYPVA
jgi:hypothetical protein